MSCEKTCKEELADIFPENFWDSEVMNHYQRKNILRKYDVEKK